MKQADFVERLTQALDLRVRASRQQSFRAISIQQRIASKLTLDDVLSL